MRLTIQYILLMLMIIASLLGMSLRPTHKLVNDSEKLILDTLIPKQFNDWHLVDMAAQLVNPEVEAAVNKIYAQTLSRTYVNANGQRVMLSIAYGEDQSDSVGAHLPEGCYGGQGFDITNNARGLLKTPYGDIPVSRLLASKNQRIEPITYWLTTGEKVAYSGWQTKKVKLKYALQGIIPDGLLMRVSTITDTADSLDINNAYDLQARFTQDLLAFVPQQQRIHLMGKVKVDNSSNRVTSGNMLF